MNSWSIVLPIYNGQQYLEKSLKSIVGQDFNDFEILVCDDGSTDDSLRIAESFLSDSRFTVIRNDTNRGLFYTLNRLVRESRGERIRLWSQDDLLKPNCLSVENEFWNRYPQVGLCYSAYDRIDESGTVVLAAQYDPTPEFVPQWLADQISFYHGCMAGNIASMSFRRDSFFKIGPFKESLRVSGDFEFFVRMAADFPIGRQQMPVVQVRSHNAQFSRWSSSAVCFMRENEPIFDELFSRLPERFLAHAKQYRIRNQDVSLFHHAVRSLPKGDVAIAGEIFRHLNRNSHLLSAFFWWFVSINKRLIKPSTPYLSLTGKTWTKISTDMT